MMSSIKLSAAAAVAALAIGTSAPVLAAPAFHGAAHAAPMARGGSPGPMAAVPRGPSTQFGTSRNFTSPRNFSASPRNFNGPRNFSGMDRDRDRDRRRFRG